MTQVDGEERGDVVRENLAFLTQAGVTDKDMLAGRLGFTNRVAMERFFFRHNIRIRPETEVSHYQDKYTYDTMPDQPTEVRVSALTCLTRQLAALGALDEIEELAGMLGLMPELDEHTRGQQLAVG